MLTQIPAELEAYKRTPQFSVSTTPRGLLKSHQTKAGTWALIVVKQGQLVYRELEPTVQSHHLTPGSICLVEPQRRHEVALGDGTEFYVEFYRAREAPSD